MFFGLLKELWPSQNVELLFRIQYRVVQRRAVLFGSVPSELGSRSSSYTSVALSFFYVSSLTVFSILLFSLLGEGPVDLEREKMKLKRRRTRKIIEAKESLCSARTASEGSDTPPVAYTMVYKTIFVLPHFSCSFER